MLPTLTQTLNYIFPYVKYKYTLILIIIRHTTHFSHFFLLYPRLSFAFLTTPFFANPDRQENKYTHHNLNSVAAHRQTKRDDTCNRYVAKRTTPINQFQRTMQLSLPLNLLIHLVSHTVLVWDLMCSFFLRS